MRQVVAYQVSALIEFKQYSLKEATHQVVMETLKDMGGAGGLIAVDSQGNIAMPFNTPGMYRGYITPEGEVKIGMYEDDKVVPEK
jgi:beta-aspartyl-peptidase (threonine type)